MIDYRPLQEIIDHRGLRLVLVRGMPRPWGKGAKALFENKGLEFIVGAQQAVPVEHRDRIFAAHFKNPMELRR
ncbi:MAG: hypothetical protein K0Q76_3124 [Panacagrimonas sp.]|jgi:hypothetical protein|nr:hypothetical protein [Panacagrimonas sp.]MCC2658016.1 hypothetical protein [Panacagrimonas sp.]